MDHFPHAVHPQVAAAEQRGDTLPPPGGGLAHAQGEYRRGRAFRDETGMIEDDGDRRFHLFLGDEVHFVDQVFQHIEGQAARVGRRQAPGKGIAGLRGHGPAFPPGPEHRRRVGRLDADEANVRVDGLDGRAHPRDQVAAAHGQHHGVRVGKVLHDLQADGARAGHESEVFPVLDVYHARVFGDLPGPREPVGDRLAVDDQFGAEAPDGLALDLRRSMGDDHRHGDVHRAASVGDALPVVAGGRRRDPPDALLFAQQGHGIQSAPDLERADGLEILVLDVEFQAQRLAEPGGTVHGRRRQMLVQETAGPGDILKCGVGGHGLNQYFVRILSRLCQGAKHCLQAIAT